MEKSSCRSRLRGDGDRRQCGLGRAIALELAARGAKVYAGARDPGKVTDAGLIPVQLDVTDDASIRALAARRQDVNILVNNAGVSETMESTLDQAFVEVFERIAAVNFGGLIRTAQAFVPQILRNGGGAINVLSVATWYSRPLLAAYAATKSAARSYTNAFRAELGERLEVLAVHVGFLDTDMTSGMDIPKIPPSDVARQTSDAWEAGQFEVLADPGTRELKPRLTTDRPFYVSPPTAA